MTKLNVGLGAVNLDGLLLGDALMVEKLGDFFALVSLQLNHFAKLRVRNESAVTVKLLLKVLEDFVHAEFLRNSLNNSPTLSAISTLVPYVDIPACGFDLKVDVVELRVHEPWETETQRK